MVKEPPRWNRWGIGFILCVLVLSLGFEILGIYGLIDNLSFLKRASASVTGIVTECDGSTICCPVVRFQAKNGKTIEMDFVHDCSFPKSVGEKVPVLYDPKNPEDARIAFGWWNWFFNIILLVLGALSIFILAGVNIGRIRYWSSKRYA